MMMTETVFCGSKFNRQSFAIEGSWRLSSRSFRKQNRLGPQDVQGNPRPLTANKHELIEGLCNVT